MTSVTTPCLLPCFHEKKNEVLRQRQKRQRRYRDTSSDRRSNYCTRVVSRTVFLPIVSVSFSFSIVGNFYFSFYAVQNVSPLAECEIACVFTQLSCKYERVAAVFFSRFSFFCVFFHPLCSRVLIPVLLVLRLSLLFTSSVSDE